MGRTDGLVIPVYNYFVNEFINGNVAFFGSKSSDKLAKYYDVKKTFYDLQLNNWDINNDDWNVENKYDTIICFRTTGFTINPILMLSNFRKIMSKNSILLIDWTSGSDHYSRDLDEWSWGWECRGKRCFGIYDNQKKYLYSSFFSHTALNSEAFHRIKLFCNKKKKYSKVSNWYEQIRAEFGNYFVLEDEITNQFNVIKENYWTPIKENGRAQFYIIQALQLKYPTHKGWGFSRSLQVPSYGTK